MGLFCSCQRLHSTELHANEKYFGKIHYACLIVVNSEDSWEKTVADLSDAEVAAALARGHDHVDGDDEDGSAGHSATSVIDVTGGQTSTDAEATSHLCDSAQAAPDTAAVTGCATLSADTVNVDDATAPQPQTQVCCLCYYFCCALFFFPAGADLQQRHYSSRTF